MRTNSTSKALRNIVLLPLFSLALFAGPSKISPDLAKTEPATKVDVIIQWSTTPGPAQHNQVIALGGILRHNFSSINAAAYTIPSNALDALAHNPEIVYISLDHRYTANATWGSYLDLFASVIWGAQTPGTVSLVVRPNNAHSASSVPAGKEY